MITRSRLLLILLLGVAAALTLLKVPVAGSQGITIVATRITGDLPVDDPASLLWWRATAVNVPLSAQNVARPLMLNPSIRSVTVRALHNGSQIALLVEWRDSTLNDSMVRVQDFPDGAAVQFALTDGALHFCMGQEDGNVNIWHWKADWQADINARRDVEDVYTAMHVDYYPFTDEGRTDALYLPAQAVGNPFASAARVSPVEDLIASGFGTLTSQAPERQNVQGHGLWGGGQWRTVFTRDLVSNEPEDISFVPGRVYPVAFAVWDGAHAERNGQKSASQWVSLRVERGADAAPRDPGSEPSVVVRESTTSASEGFAVMILSVLAANVLCVAPLVVGGLLMLGLLQGKRS